DSLRGAAGRDGRPAVGLGLRLHAAYLRLEGAHRHRRGERALRDLVPEGAGCPASRGWERGDDSPGREAGYRVGGGRPPRLPRLDRIRGSHAGALRRRLPGLPRLHPRDRPVPEPTQPAPGSPGRFLSRRTGRPRRPAAMVDRAGAEPAPGHTALRRVDRTHRLQRQRRDHVSGLARADLHSRAALRGSGRGRHRRRTDGDRQCSESSGAGHPGTLLHRRHLADRTPGRGRRADSRDERLLLFLELRTAQPMEKDKTWIAATADELVQEPPGATVPDFPNWLGQPARRLGVQNVWITVSMYGVLYFCADADFMNPTGIGIAIFELTLGG